MVSSGLHVPGPHERYAFGEVMNPAIDVGVIVPGVAHKRLQLQS